MTLHRSSLVALGVLAVGCAALPNMGDDTCTTDAGCTIIPGDEGSADGGPAFDGYFVDAGAPPPLSRSSLCAGECAPDNAASCASNSLDAGVNYADAEIEACRVVLGAGQQTESKCVKAGTGADGASCTSGADCMAGLECVGTGTCRPYCCESAACDKLSNQTSTTYFCDVANEHASSGAVVPVCNAVVHCAPFNGSCNTGEACTIVEINNGSSVVATCAATGDAKLGESCEQVHCADGFACLGPLGERTCQQLCDSLHPCPASMSCNTQYQALMTYKVGICK